jgi:hypothetical protein
MEVLTKMTNWISVEQLEEQSGHRHDFKFYDNHDDTFDTIRDKPNRDPVIPIGTVWECYCGAREIRFIVWTGKYDLRKKNQNE